MATGSGTSGASWDARPRLPRPDRVAAVGRGVGVDGRARPAPAARVARRAVDHRDGGEDEPGGRGVGPSPGRPDQRPRAEMAVIDAEIELTLDDDGAPLEGGAPRVVHRHRDRHHLHSRRLGATWMEPPAPPSSTPRRGQRAGPGMFDGPRRSGSSVPSGWELSGAYVTPRLGAGVRQRHRRLHETSTTPRAASCGSTCRTPTCMTRPEGEPIDVRRLLGTVADVGDGDALAARCVGGRRGGRRSTDLSVADLGLVLSQLWSASTWSPCPADRDRDPSSGGPVGRPAAARGQYPAPA